MNRPTLAGRVAAAQVGLTFLALAAVIVGSSLAVGVILGRNRDEVLLETARRTAELVARSGPYALDAEWMERELAEVRPREVRVELRDPTGFSLATSGPDWVVGDGGLGCHTDAARRVCAIQAGILTVVVSADPSPDRAVQRRLLVALAAVALFAAVLVGLAGRRVAKRALAPLLDLTRRIESIEPGTSARVGVASDLAEVELLRARFDALVERFDEALVRERRLTAQASHELRTPLGVARAEIEALSEVADVQGAQQRALAALDRLSDLVEALLWFARAQERLDDDRIGIVNVADLFRAQAAEREGARLGPGLSCALPDEALVRGDERLLGRVAANLLDNALKYGAGGPVRVFARQAGAVLRLHVENRGSLPPSGDAERLFEPFYRGAGAPADVPGFGLGLPLARAVARVHGGDVELASGDDDVTVFVLTLPLVHWSPGSAEPLGGI